MPKTPGEKKRLKGAGRVAFLARIDEVRKEVAEGWPLVAIFDRHKGQLGGLSYSQFTRYVQRYVNGSTNNGPTPKAPAARKSPQGGQASKPITPESRQPGAEGGETHPTAGNKFKWKTTAGDNDDLI